MLFSLSAALCVPRVIGAASESESEPQQAEEGRRLALEDAAADLARAAAREAEERRRMAAEAAAAQKQDQRRTS